ncbi:MAG: class I SAM-dependent methyltransferase, partial [Lachnospiraceae bacterium]|nr:class I SAM-dependent methyltransferase [Lachnospiraceae bacterium]
MNDFSYDILDLLKKYDNDTNAALAGENCPQCLYAFSPLRENLFEWVKFEPDARILQIGSDYGSFTGILAERVKEVVVLDPRDENLEVNRIRHGERENVIYVRGDLRDQVQWKVYKPKLEAEAKEIMFRPFDYIILGGFLMDCKKEEAIDLLREAADYLKPGGAMLAAVENETGVRYWMG